RRLALCRQDRTARRHPQKRPHRIVKPVGHERLVEVLNKLQVRPFHPHVSHFALITCPMLLVVTSTRGNPPWTSTVVVVVPIFSSTFLVTIVATSSLRSVNATVSKPGWEYSTRYTPMGSVANRYWPALSAAVSEATPVP